MRIIVSIAFIILTINNAFAQLSKTDSVKTIVYGEEGKPEFIKGQNELIKYIYKQLRYPTGARVTDSQGVIYLGVRFGNEGNVVDVKIQRNETTGEEKHLLLEEALRVVHSLPKYIPNDGETYADIYTIPIRFKLE